jgi:hypothetical protein
VIEMLEKRVYKLELSKDVGYALSVSHSATKKIQKSTKVPKKTKERDKDRLY